MSVSIRLSRGGSKKRPYYKLVVSNSRAPRDGKYLEQLGTYNPLLAKDDENRVRLIEDRVRYWLGVGAQPTEAVVAIFKRSGDWQTFSGDTSPSGIDPQREPRDKAALFNKALAEADGAPAVDAISTSRKKTAKAAEPEAVADAPAAVSDDAVEQA